MARRSRVSVLKRQRELRKAEKAARKRAKRHGIEDERFTVPEPTVRVSELVGQSDAPSDSDDSGPDADPDATPSKPSEKEPS